MRATSLARLWAFLLIAGGLLGGTSARALDVDRVEWGFDGHVVPMVFNLVTIEVANNSATPFEGALEARRTFKNSVMIEGVGGTTHAGSLSGVACTDDKIADYLRSNTIKTIMGDIKFGAKGEWAKSRMLQVQYHDIKGNGLDQFKGMSTQTVIAPADLKTGKLIYPYEKAK